jgi:hypothetical protein
MRIFVALICSLALASLAPGAQEQKKKEKEKKGAQAGEVSKPGAKGGGRPTEAGKPAGGPKQAKTRRPAEAGKPAERGNAATAGMPAGKEKGKGKHTKTGQGAGAEEATAGGKPKGGGRKAEAGKPTETGATTTAGKPAGGGKPGKAGVAAGKPAKHFDLPKQPNTAKAPPVKFQQGKRIEGSQNWQGQNYTVFRNYTAEWHDQGWWHSHYNNIVFVFGAPYFFNAGYWFPAWGYSPNAYYAYDGPIYAYNNLPPDQVIANVQAALQQQGYYQGEVDGLVGPLTREALAGYQRDHGLYETAAIDQPTLESLGMT